MLSRGRWETRGWTYQESVASQALLYFTDSRIHLEIGTGDRRSQYTEGEASSRFVIWYITRMLVIQEYTRRTLRYSEDILRAITGILTAVYGTRMSFGIPWDEFSRAMLWSTTEFHRQPRYSTDADIFRTWSWTSANVPIYLTHPYDQDDTSPFTLAYWCRAVKDTDNGREVSWWKHIKTTKKWRSVGHTENSIDWKDGDILMSWSSGATPLALAWANGCIRSETPGELAIDCVKFEYELRLRRLQRRIPIWQDIFVTYQEMNLFN
jgi:hypothetical protein